MTQVTSDTFPATVTFTDAQGQTKTLERVRVITTTKSVLVWRDSTTNTQQPELIYSQPVTSFEKSPEPQRLREMYNRKPHTAVVENGTVLTWGRGGCACGSRLKSFRPFATMDAIDTPKELA